MNVQYVELDVHMSSDGEVVVIHDSRVDRTTNGRGTVRGLTLAQLKALDAGTWYNRIHPKRARQEFAGTRIPHLREVLELVRETEAGLFVELKDPELYPEDFEERVITLLRRNEFQKRVTLLSFNAGSLKKVKSLDSGIRTALLMESTKTDPAPAAAAVGADGLAIRHTILTSEIMRTARHGGLGVVVWTVNSKSAMQRAIALDVDCIISNYPDRVQRLLLE